MEIRPLVGALSLWWLVAAASADTPARHRLPAPQEDTVSTLETPVCGKCASLTGTDETFAVMEWVAKRTWHVLGLPYERKDFTGPPAMKIERRDGWMEVAGTVGDGGVPSRNQVITARVEQLDGSPLLMTLRSADAFGELLVELDLKAGRGRAWSVTVNRSMIGGQSHSSPMPEQSFAQPIAKVSFEPIPTGGTELKVRTLGDQVTISARGRQIMAFTDPDPAGGKFGFGSVGRMRFRDVNQWELISEAERDRRAACHKAMHTLCVELDQGYDADVRARNRMELHGGTAKWTWPATGATAEWRVEGPRVLATVQAGLYGHDTLIEGAFPEVTAVTADGHELGPDPTRQAELAGDALGIRMRLPLSGPSGERATVEVLARLTVQTVWFWTITIDGAACREIRAAFAPAEAFKMSAPDKAASGPGGMSLLGSPDVLRHNGKAGFYVKAIEAAKTVLGVPAGQAGQLALATTASSLRFATSILPAQPLNPVGLRNRMVHFIRYPEGPIEHWRRQPSVQEYPTDVDLARFAANGTDAMVWHHTWLSSDFRDREGFMVNPPEMRRAMDRTHQLGMKAIGYLGIVPGRNPLLGFEDTVGLNNRGRYGGYPKNWDLQDQTFYHVGSRYGEFIVWMADYWCREYGLDGFYLDGGAFGLNAAGPTGKPLHQAAAGLSLDELEHRTYWRIRKVLERNKSGYGLEPWSGLNWLINGFYDCMMIGESFQEAPPEYYRDGHNALLTGCAIKMYGMRESSQNPYNIAMAAVNLSDIQVCSGNGAWGDVADTSDTWRRVRPLWDLLESIDWEHLISARPWYAQDLVGGNGFYAGSYITPRRAMVFVANRAEQPGAFDVRIDTAVLPKANAWSLRYCLGRTGDIGPLGDGRLRIELPALHDGPIGIELLAE